MAPKRCQKAPLHKTELPDDYKLPSNDIGWKHGIPVDGNRHKVECIFCGAIVSGGITRLKQHLAGGIGGEVHACLIADGDVKREMTKADKKKRDEQLRRRLRPGGDDDNSDDDDEARDMAYARHESLREQREYEERMRYKTASRAHYDEGGSSGAAGSSRQPLRKSSSVHETSGVGGSSRSSQWNEWIDPHSPKSKLRDMEPPQIQKSKSTKQPKLKQSLIKKARQKLRDAWGNFIVYNRLPFYVVASPWAQPLIDTTAEVGAVKNHTPYGISEVFVNQEYEEMKRWIDSFKGIWRERGVTIMCDGWTGPTHTHIINFLVYSNRGTVFHKSIDASDVASRTANYYFKLMDKVVDEVGEENIVQIVTDNEAAMKAAGQMLMQKRHHLYWTACAAHCIDLILEDIGKKSSVKKILEDARTITSFIYNHTWVIDYMKKFTDGRELLRTSITRFATNFIALESLLRYKRELRDMVNSDGWKNSVWGKKKNEPAVEMKNIILGKDFWQKVVDIVKVEEPIVKVLKLVDGDERPTMGFIYEAMDRAKLAIQRDCRYYKDYWKIIDRRWNFQLHHDLHAAGKQ